ncbi:poly(R)-hydroxyalkanoic acid synthase, class III, PhaC subunit [Gloeothece citriformis PCC 7424]|uniref:Poly(3-hydroxyalkanoate) polymerase subunit PhaC n=1 Tax=Gloeothece citriformis (strain PCC 7424) TaxID=65393 RepID=B7KDE2_GLOC7|nr:class III poly(R)-hydroxyalkanoic acid synthase subunit PhaC [Gloeothece citriformis]ACK68962.1 poly(R)-hydroxyalkanoic acid synthase, class III, PhaC subunit [Gloeothece citriformis PCC 7424]
MLPFLDQIRLEDAVHEYTEITKKMIKGLDNLSRLREEDIESGVSPKEVVYQEDKVVLYRFKSQVEHPLPIPLLMVYALVNRPFMVDLQEGRSLVANLLKLGLDVYLIDWGYPTRADRWLTLDDYINGYINNCVDFIRKQHNLDKINLLGICQGGTFSVCYSAIYPEKVKNLIVMVAPIDFRMPGTLLNMRGGCTIGAEALDVDLMIDSMGNVPGDYLNLEFLMLKPLQLGYQKYLDFPDIMENESKLANFMRMEKWIFDSPDQAGEAYRQFMKDFYQSNKLIKNEVVIGNKPVNLQNLTMPILNLYAELDHLVDPASSKALEKYVNTTDYIVQSFPVGHIGMYVSGKVQATLPPTIVEWLTARA